MHTPLSILQKYWQYPCFRPLQESIIQHVLEGNDTLAILPTGAGKSICYQIPALLLQGASIVVSPLIALMKDQALGLKKRGISCAIVHTGMSSDEVEQVYIKMTEGAYKFLFVSPERLKSNLFLDFFPHWKISLLAIDEAHCISQWGYDFRPPYLEIAAIRMMIPGVPVIALSASATPFVQKDIIEKLAFKNGQTFFSTFKRDNLSISTLEVESKMVKLLDIVEKVKGTKIVYCKNRKRTKEIAELLISNGFSADYYHAGLAQEVRNKKQDSWLSNHTETIVCTNAFGMGIDKADVRCVIHFDIPDTPEAYYQEMGRAGRDGLKSYAVVLYNQKDIEALKLGIEQKYPPLNTIKEIYQSLAYYFEVGIGSGNESVFDFEISDFCKKFDHQVIETLSSIKILEQQGFWAISESVYMPSKVSVIASKEAVTLFEERLPDYDEILKLLLRMYGGIWNHYIPIDEFLMAQKAQVSTDYIHHILQQLHKHHMIDYRQRRSNPQITYLHDRVDLMFLKIDMQLMATLKARYEERVHFMIDFITNRHTCKAKHLIAFFGEKIEDDCKICDNCLAYKKTLQADEFVRIKNTILQHISFHKSLHVPTFCKNLRSNEVEKTMKIIRFLLDEKKLKLNESGDLIIS
ncbi:MAG TPA: RecQ family ATP-dependent DNA helicase [Chitinophagaceae bacterium]|nr:RecQ family ATP-dependent DNA helicase [Chitinophagaceae bacterium]